MRWCIYLDEFGATYHYKKGENNQLANALSQVPVIERERSVPTQIKCLSSSPVQPDRNKRKTPITTYIQKQNKK